MDEDLETFEVHSSPESVSEEPRFEGTNAARFAIAGTLDELGPVESGDSSILLPGALDWFGFNPAFAEGARPLVQRPLDGEVLYLAEMVESGWTAAEARATAWRDLNERADASPRLAFLVAGLSSALERESVTAAVSLLGTMKLAPTAVPAEIVFAVWQLLDVEGRALTESPLFWSDDVAGLVPSEWRGLAWRQRVEETLDKVRTVWEASSLDAVVWSVAQVRVRLAQKSADPIVRQIAAAAQLQRVEPGDSPEEESPRPRPGSIRQHTSTMVHGTLGWKGDWWYPGGDYFEYVAGLHRHDLYRGGGEFSWSGALSERQRAQAADRLARWIDGVGGGHLDTVFAHSYGGEVVARAVNAGTLVDDVVLLSAPINQRHRDMVDRVSRVIDVRLKVDIVLILAGAGQSIPDQPSVTRFIVDRPFWSHNATHSPKVWEEESIAVKVGL
ncbi:alpha/beta hydrolase [Cryobacterium sp. PH31-AA6]|uniref:alpha/beta hydrolase n=1 Tax=Cryobacterium sp. PH31-AA6 TaxID=3046205 RepID=UPI0024BAC684|nr:alpha/beta hydrolase [Cryobacterium sp. PH31-AA6]MDJ0324712.1 alpha/beta hydrolase [Cryobacterium sp. PH31-AA6]